MKKKLQVTDTFVMIRPDHFGYNSQTAVTNVFQKNPLEDNRSASLVRESALNEFEEMVSTFRKSGLRVLVLQSPVDVVSPDAVFPNNWFSHHQNNTLIFYPMLTPNRQAERQPEKLLHYLSTIQINPRIIDYTGEEKKGHILEGTGSMVIDRVHKVAFAIESQRTNKQLFYTWCENMEYEPFLFHASTSGNIPIYHTNVFMSIGEDFVVYCPSAIVDAGEKQKLEEKLILLKKELIPISIKQVYAFCGNILQVKTNTNVRKIILSKTAFDALTIDQRSILEKHGGFLVMDISTIEKVAGGGTRCMIAEIFT